MRAFHVALSLTAAVVLLAVAPTFAEDWAVHVKEDADPDAVAASLGLVNAGEVVPESNVFHFRLPQTAQSRRRKRSPGETAATSDQLRAHPEVALAQEQESLVRVKRAPPSTRLARAPEELCFINTEVNDAALKIRGAP
jgi:hypothetical protein